MKPLISIIMPAFNVEEFIEDAIISVLNQTYHNWELIIINDGSSDLTKDIIHRFNDERIIYFEQINKGVSSARNLGINKMRGSYFCFLDADDIYTPKSLNSRLEIFLKNKKINIVDGKVEIRDVKLVKLLKLYQPTFKGKIFNQYLKLNENCFIGNTCMIKRDLNKEYSFKDGLTHGEDLLFYLSLGTDTQYSHCNDIILIYRNRPNSAMNNYHGLEEGYLMIFNYLNEISEVTYGDKIQYFNKVKSIMFKTYFRNGYFCDAFRIFKMKNKL